MAKRAVYIGGFGNGKANAEYVAEALHSGLNYDDVDYFTFSTGMSKPDVIRRAAHGVDLWTHSAGFLAAKDTSPRRIDALNAPIPTSKLRLIARTGIKTMRMHIPTIGIKTPQDIGRVLRYDTSAAADLIAHPKANLGNLGAISRFDAIEAAIAAREAGIAVGLGYTEDDEYFQPTFGHELHARQNGVDFVRTPGIHDEVVLHPPQMLAAYLAKKSLNL